MKSIITADMVRHQAYKFYLAPCLFYSYLIFMPYCYQTFGFIFTIVFALVPGAFIYSWICFLLHETWHKYVPNLPNTFLFNLNAWLLASDPQVYHIAHGSHHAHTHTWKDIEFYPRGKIENKYIRRLCNFLQFTCGQLFIYNFTLFNIKKHPRFSWQRHFFYLGMVVIIYGSVFMIAHYLLNIETANIFIAWVLFTLIGGSVQHTSQLIEHWGIIDEEKSLLERNLLSRNLKPDGLIEKAFLYLTHWDSHEHLLHHLYPGKYTRPFSKAIAMPAQAIHINFKDYLKIAWRVITS